MGTSVDVDLGAIVKAVEASPVFSLDLETTDLDPRKSTIRGVSLSVGPNANETWWIPFKGAGAVSQVHTFRELAPALSNPEKVIVGSGIKFDLKHLKINGVEVKCRPACTVVASWLTNENIRVHGLKEQIEREYGVKMMKYAEAISYEGDLFGEGKFEQYAKDDSYYVRRLFVEKLEPRLKADKLEKLFWSVEMEIVRVLVDMELAGVAIDLEYLSELRLRIEKQMEEAKAEAVKLAGRDFDITSPKTVSLLLFNELKLPIREGMVPGKSGYHSTDDDILGKYGGVPIVQSILKHRKAAHTKSTFVMPYLERTKDEKRVFADFRQAGTRAFRFSCQNPNLQQIPQEKGLVKKMFVAAPGKSLICGDWNQLQFRLIGHFAKRWCGKSIVEQAYKQGSDLHEKTRTELKLPDRRKAKVVNFAFLFGRGWKSFAEAEGFEMDIAKAYYNGFHKTYPEIRKCSDHCREDICRQGYVTSLTGRRRRFPEAKGKSPDSRFDDPDNVWWDGWRAWNSVVQMGESDLVRLSLRNIWRDIQERRKTSPIWREAEILIQVHDELVGEAPDEIAEEFAAMMKHHAANSMILDVPILMEVGIAKNWEDAKH